MRKVTLSGLLARKLRLALTALAIVLGVTFVTGTLILGDTLNSTFNNLIGTAYQHVSFEIRGKAVLNESGAAAVQGTDRPQAGPGVDRDRRQPRPGRRVRARLGRGLRPVPRPRRKRDRERRRLDARASRSTPTGSCLRYRLVEGKAPDDRRRRGDGQGDGDQAPLRGRRPRADATCPTVRRRSRSPGSSPSAATTTSPG